MSTSDDWLEEEEPFVCCICGEPAVEYYQDNEDCPVCNRWSCGLAAQAGIDYHDEIGSR
jgi:hypothetical protein